MTEQGLEALVLNPGDRVLIALAPETDRTMQDLQAMAETLRDRFPNVEFTFIGDVAGLAVQREEASA